MVLYRIGGRRTVRKPLIGLADIGKAAVGALARAPQPVPADDGDVVLPIDPVAAPQAARHVAIDGIAGQDLRADGARARELDTRIVGDGPQALEQETGHRRAVDDSLPGPEVG